MTNPKESLCAQVEQRLLEAIADLLAEEAIQRWEVLARCYDPQPPDQTELHIRMAKAALAEYARTIVSIP